MHVKRTRDARQGTPAQPPPPAHRQERLFKLPKHKLSRDKPQQSARSSREEPEMNELVEFIHTHEESFKSRNRLASLYADFRSQQNTNPEGYTANLNAWKKAFEHAAHAGVIPSPGATRNLLLIDTGSELSRALQHKDYGLPTCLRDVFLDAIKKGAFVPVQEWNASTQSIYHKSWLRLPKVSVSGVLSGAWELGKSSLLGPSSQPPVGCFVVVANVEAAAEAILSDYGSRPHTSTADRIFSKAAFWKRFSKALNSSAPLTVRDLDVLLVHMVRDRQAMAYDGNTIKFKDITDQRPSPITEEDTAMAQLHDATEKVRARITLLQANATKCELAAKEAVQLKQLVRAKTCLRKKKLAESALEYHTNLSLQLEESYMKLQQAADHVGVLAAMQAGAEAMAILNKKVGGAEGVQKVVDFVNEEISTTEEISSIINESADPIDEGEIDDEFAELERQEKEKKEREEALKAAELLAELPEPKKARKEDDGAEVEVSMRLSQMSIEPEENEDERIPVAA